MYDIENFYQASNVEDAVNMLHRDPGAVLISGGTDVLIKIREGRMAGCSLVSIHGLKELDGVCQKEDKTILIGPGTVFSRLTEDPVIQGCVPILGVAAGQVGSPQIRNMGTIGGNVCNGVTSADSAPSLLVLNAVLRLTGPGGVREVPLKEFYTGPGRTVRKHDEILTAIEIKREDYEGFGGCYIKYGKREAMEISTLGCAVNLLLESDKRTVKELRIAYGVAAPTPVRCHKTEKAAVGMEAGKKLSDMVAESVTDEVNPRSSFRASREFRMHLIRELSKRALSKAVRQAGGEADA